MRFFLLAALLLVSFASAGYIHVADKSRCTGYQKQVRSVEENDYGQCEKNCKDSGCTMFAVGTDEFGGSICEEGYCPCVCQGSGNYNGQCKQDRTNKYRLFKIHRKSKFGLNPYGSKECKPGLEIKSKSDCEKAIRSLDFRPTVDTWSAGNWPYVPRYCSVKNPSKGSQPHYNYASSGRGRDDLAPICKTPEDSLYVPPGIVHVADKKECSGRDYSVGYVDENDFGECAKICLKRYPLTTLFIVGTNDFGNPRCEEGYCKCYCEKDRPHNCNQVTNTGYRLFKITEEFGVGGSDNSYVSLKSNLFLAGACVLAFGLGYYSRMEKKELYAPLSDSVNEK